MKRRLFLIMMMLFMFIDINAYADTYQDAVKNTAYAYFYRGKAIQYDSSPMTYETQSKKRVRDGGSINEIISPLLYFSPERATNQDPKYVVCSTFVENVYYEAFKKNNVGFLFNHDS